jgi:hypothetical protein
LRPISKRLGTALSKLSEPLPLPIHWLGGIAIFWNGKRTIFQSGR